MKRLESMKNEVGVLDAIRTRGLMIRNRALYPAELRGQILKPRILHTINKSKLLYFM